MRCRNLNSFLCAGFFEKILDGKLSVKEIYEEAAKLSLQIDAPCYNLLLFSFYEKEKPDIRNRPELFSAQAG